MKRILACAVLLTVASPSFGAEVGRLFYTPAERAQLDVARTQKKAPPPPATQAREAAAPEIVNYGGIVRRSDGKAMLWINNRLADEKEALGSLKGSVRADGAVTLRVPDSSGSVEVKVGQSVDLQSGRVAEGYKVPVEAKPAPTDTKSDAPDAKAAATPKSAASEGAEKKSESERKETSPPLQEKPRQSGNVAAR